MVPRYCLQKSAGSLRLGLTQHAATDHGRDGSSVVARPRQSIDYAKVGARERSVITRSTKVCSWRAGGERPYWRLRRGMRAVGLPRSRSPNFHFTTESKPGSTQRLSPASLSTKECEHGHVKRMYSSLCWYTPKRHQCLAKSFSCYHRIINQLKLSCHEALAPSR
jgi:hypothetical protein